MSIPDLGWLVVVLVGCYRSAPPSVEAPTAVVTTPPAAEHDPAQACQRYHALFQKLAECPGLPEEERQRLVQIDTDLGAAASESGMEGASPFDTERGCEEASAIVLEVASSICGWTR